MMRIWLRSVAVMLALGAALLAGVGPASAHSYLVSADPADGTSLAQGPGQVTLTFNEELQTAFDSLSVVGPDGNRWSTGETSVQGAKASIGLTQLGPVGKYTVAYRVVSADSHPVAGTVAFTLTTAGNGTPGPKANAAQTPTATAGRDGGVSAWPFVVGAVVVLGIGVAVVTIGGKRKPA